MIYFHISFKQKRFYVNEFTILTENRQTHRFELDDNQQPNESPAAYTERNLI